MTQRHALSVVTFLVLGLAAACGDKSKSGSSSGTPLEGTWESDCRNVTGAGVRTTMVFSGASYGFTTSFYEDGATCLTDYYKVETRGGFTIGATIAGDTGAREINYEQTGANLTAESNAGASMLAGTCGISTFTVGKKEDILGKTCDTAFKSFASVHLYDIYKITAGTNLNIGSDPSGDTTVKEHRPTTLDDQVTFVKR